MRSEPMLLKGSTCPICKSKMYVDETKSDLTLGCSKKDCDYNDKKKREVYFKEKRTNIIVGDVLHKMRDGPKIKC